MAKNITNHRGLNANQINVKNSLEDFLMVDYTLGLQNEFSTMEALINKLSTDTITGKYRTKTFALGITDNIRALGKSNDMYELDYSDFTRGADTVEAQFNTTKLMGFFSITDETMLLGTTDGSIFDVVRDSLARLEMNLKHTQARFTYGSSKGSIGLVTLTPDEDKDFYTIKSGDNTFLPTGKKYIECTAKNSHSMLPGMGVMIKVGKVVEGEGEEATTTYLDPESAAFIAAEAAEDKDTSTLIYVGRIWQKFDTDIHAESMYITLDVIKETGTTTAPTVIPVPEAGAAARIYSRQLIHDGVVNAEYTGLEEIVLTKNNKIFNVDRNIYKALNCTVKDLENKLLTESTLRDMADHIALTSPEQASINLMVSNHRIVSTVEKQMYQFKQYSLDTKGNGFQLGRPNIVFDNFEMMKDKYSRDQNVYMLDTGKIGELLRKDFAWITSGRETILERRDGTEVYEAIMTKYGDMYIDSFKTHAAFTNAAETVTVA